MRSDPALIPFSRRGSYVAVRRNRRGPGLLVTHLHAGNADPALVITFPGAGEPTYAAEPGLLTVCASSGQRA